MAKTKYQQLEDKDWLVKELETWPMRHIAERLGCSYSGVHSAVKRHGIVVPKRSGYIYTEETRQRKSLSQKIAYERKYPNGRFGELHPHWKGGKRTAGHQGYVRIYAPDHPEAVQGSIFEHRLVAEKKIGRHLTKDEVVHHINGDKQDNRPENLEVLLRRDHVHSHHISGKRISALHKRIAYLEGLLVANGIHFD